MTSGVITSEPTRGSASRTAVERELAAFFSRKTEAAARYDGAFGRLWEVAGRNATGGKLVRPMLMVDTFDALRAQVGQTAARREAVVTAAVAVELLHYAFLLHDDVIDGDLTRRGRSNVVGALAAEAAARRAARRESPDVARAPDAADAHWARTGGILMGDLLLTGSLQLCAQLDLPRGARAPLLETFDHAITESAAGEQLDVELSDGLIDPALQTVLAMCAYKTATYTFELPLRAAAVLAGAPQSVSDALAAVGRHLGLAFQLQDDLLSTFGDPLLHGKDPFSDLREGKQTAIIAYARTTDAWPKIEQALSGAELSAAAGVLVRDQLEHCGARSFVEELVADQCAAADAMLAGDTRIPSAACGVLRRVAAALRARNS